MTAGAQHEIFSHVILMQQNIHAGTVVLMNTYIPYPPLSVVDTVIT